MALSDRIKRLETASAPSRAERWRAEMARAQRACAEGCRNLLAVIDAKLVERGIDASQLLPLPPAEHAQAKRELLDLLRGRLHESGDR